VSSWSSWPRATSPGKVSWGYAHYPQIYRRKHAEFKPNFKCSPLKFFEGTLSRFVMCASKLCESLSPVKISGASASKKPIQVVQTHRSYFLDSGSSSPDSTGLDSLNAGGIALDHIYIRFLISCLVPEIFAIKVGSCVKSAQIWHIFGPQNFLGKGPRIFGLALQNSARYR